MTSWRQGANPLFKRIQFSINEATTPQNLKDPSNLTTFFTREPLVTQTLTVSIKLSFILFLVQSPNKKALDILSGEETIQ